MTTRTLVLREPRATLDLGHGGEDFGAVSEAASDASVERSFVEPHVAHTLVERVQIGLLR